MGVKVTIVVEDYAGDWVTLELESECMLVLSQDQNEMFDYLFGLVIGDGIEANDRSYIIIIDYTDGTSSTRWKLL